MAPGPHPQVQEKSARRGKGVERQNGVGWVSELRIKEAKIHSKS